MKRIERSAAGIFAAVFLSGAVLLGARARGQPRGRAVLRQLDLRLGRAHRRRAHRALRRLLVGGVLADRFPTPLLLLGALTLGAAHDPARSRSSTAGCSSRSSSWDPGPRWNPLVATVILFGLPSVVLATATPIAVRLRARSIASLGKTAGRLFAVSTAGSIVGTFATAFLLIPELGTNQLLGVLATRLFVAAGLVALGEGMLVPGVAVAALVVASAWATVELEPKQGGRALRSRRAELVAAVPRARRRGRSPSPVRGIRARLLEEHALPRSDGRRRRGLAVPAVRELVPERDVPRRPVPHAVRATPTSSQLPLAYSPRRARSSSSGSAAARRRSGSGATSRSSRSSRSSSTRSSATSRTGTSGCRASSRLQVDGRGRPPLPPAQRRALGRDRDRRVLLRLDPVPPDDDRVPRARALAPRPGGVVVINMIGSTAGDGSKLFRSMYRTYRAVFPTVTVHPVALPATSDGRCEHDRWSRPRAPRRRRRCCSSAGRTLRGTCPTRRRPGEGDPRPQRAPRPDSRRPDPHGRLRADRRAAASRVAV